MADRVEYGKINYLFLAKDGNLERGIEQSEYDERKDNNDPFVRLTAKGRPVEFFNGGMSLGRIVGFEDVESKSGFKIVKLVVDYGDGKDVFITTRKGSNGLTSTFKSLVNQIAGVDLTRPVKIKPYVKKSTYNGKEYTSDCFYVTYEDGTVVHNKYTYKKEESVIPPIEKVEKLGEVAYDSSKQDEFFWNEFLQIKAKIASLNNASTDSSSSSVQNSASASNVQGEPAPVQTTSPVVQNPSVTNATPVSEVEDFDDLPF